MKGCLEQLLFLHYSVVSYVALCILESNDKKYARIKALKIVIEEIEKAL